MIKRSKIRRPVPSVVAPPPSRIRREPPGRVPDKAERAYPSEREMWTVVIGVLMFGIAIAILTFKISEYTN